MCLHLVSDTYFNISEKQVKKQNKTALNPKKIGLAIVMAEQTRLYTTQRLALDQEAKSHLTRETPPKYVCKLGRLWKEHQLVFSKLTADPSPECCYGTSP